MTDGPERSTSLSYRLLILAIPAFIALYFTVAALPSLLGHGRELYLFYSWFVFAKVPAREQITYEAIVLSAPDETARGKPLESTALLLRDEVRNVPEYRRRIRMIGDLLARSKTSAAEAQRLALESFLVLRPIDYEIVQVTYNPIHRFLRNDVIATTSMGIYRAL